MNRHLYNALMALHNQLADCECVKRNNECTDCIAVGEALHALERSPRLLEMSERVGESVGAQNAS